MEASGVMVIWHSGDAVIRSTLLCLLTMGLASWSLLLLRLRDQNRVLRAARAAAASFWLSPNLHDAVQRLNRASPFRTVIEAGLGAREQHRDVLAGQIALADRVTARMERSVESVGKRLESGLELVASMAATAPWVGLFGTVWGTYTALAALSAPGPETMQVIAGPVGRSLMMTGFGLAVAVPVLLAHRWVVRRNALAMSTLREFSLDARAVLLNGPGTRREPEVA